jgi:hypothetical protein
MAFPLSTPNKAMGSSFLIEALRVGPFPPSPLNTERDMHDMELVLLASELRTRAKEILIKAAGTRDPETKGMMRVVAADYQSLARRVEERVREAEMA